MYPKQIYEELKGWSEATLILLRNLLPLMAPVARHDGWSAEQRETLSHLLTATARSSESALLLTAYGQLWDAEVLVRSTFEGSLKLAYILQSRSSFAERHDEYRHDLFKIALLKDHAKAAELLAALPDGDQPKWKPIRDRLLSEDELADIAARYPQKRRRALDTRWGFTGILGELARSGDPLFRGFAGLADGYSMASHIVHADHIGTALPLDRDRRSAERRDSILLAHGARLLSDVMSCLQIRLFVGYRFIGHSDGPIREASEAIHQLTLSFGPVFERWMAAEYPSGEDWPA